MTTFLSRSSGNNKNGASSFDVLLPSALSATFKAKALRAVLWSVFLVSGSSGSAFGLTFSEDFEGSSLAPSWSVIFQQSAQVALSSEQAHSGLQSLKLNSLPGNDRYVILAHDFGQAMTGTVSVWFYDTYPGQQTLYANFRLGDAANEYRAAGMVGVQDWDPSYYHIPLPVHSPSDEGRTTIGRSSGWHSFEETVSSTSVDFRIDGQAVLSLPYSGGFSGVSFSLSGPSWRPNAAYYFDDLTSNLSPLTAVPEPETYTMMLAGFGLLGFFARRRKLQPA